MRDFILAVIEAFKAMFKKTAADESPIIKKEIKKVVSGYKFGARSKKNLGEAHQDLQRLFNEVIKVVDCAVIEGHRPKSEQDRAYLSGKSKLKFPRSKHNSMPSQAVDVVPWPLNWRDTKRFYEFGELVVGIASEMNIGIRWGGDWDGDGDYRDQSFNDLVHFELAPYRIKKREVV